MTTFFLKKIFPVRLANYDVKNHLESYWHGQVFISWLVANPVDNGISDEPVSAWLRKNGATIGEVVLLEFNKF